MRTLKDLTEAELLQLLKTNKQLNNKAIDDAYAQSMFMQEEDFKLMHADVFDYHDHYSSFYLRTPNVYGSKTPEKVAHELNSDYMDNDVAKVYEELNTLIDQWEDMTTDEQDEHEELYQKACDTCDKLAEMITEQLRRYEAIENDFVESEFLYNATEGYMQDWEVTDDNKVIETIYNTYQ